MTISGQTVIGVAAAIKQIALPFGHVDAHTVYASYVDAIARAGGTPVVLPMGDAGIVPSLVDLVDGVVLTGGEDLGTDTDRDAFEIALLRHARSADKRVFGVCRGLHVMNVALGGSLTAHVEGHLGGDIRHHLRVTDGTLLAGLVGPHVTVGSLHHQAIDRVAESLRVSAVADDGFIEAAESPCGRLLGVQWHPELDGDAAADAMLAWLVQGQRP